MIGKKGEEGMGTLVAIILVAVTAIILFSFSGELFAKGKSASDIEACRLSVIAQSKTKIAGRTSVSLKCPRREIVFFNNKVEINGKKSSGYDFKHLSRDIVNMVLAEELRLCWYRMGEGKEEVFGEDLILDFNIVCSICSDIKFDKEVVESGRGVATFSDLIPYLKSKKLSDSKTQGISLWDYFTKIEGFAQFENYAVVLSLEKGFVNPVDLIKQGLKAEEIETMVPEFFESSFSPEKSYSVYYEGLKSSSLAQITGVESVYATGILENRKVAEKCKNNIAN